MVQINFHDLPGVDHKTRASELMSCFRKAQTIQPQHLWMTIYRAHKKTFWREWILAGVQSAAAYAPQMCLYKTLTILEEQQANGGIGSSKLWFWAIGIGVARLVQQALESRFVLLHKTL
jgi:hypothetical protein